jgi:arylsulfatase
MQGRMGGKPEKLHVYDSEERPQIDSYVGRLLDTVDELGILDNTIFIFTSDNGPEFSREWVGSAGPRGGTDQAGNA